MQSMQSMSLSCTCTHDNLASLVIVLGNDSAMTLATYLCLAEQSMAACQRAVGHQVANGLLVQRCRASHHQHGSA